jgi:hypothetical protein
VEGTPNALAYLALILCPFVSVALVGLIRSPAVAVAIIILAGQMFLPPKISLDIPLFHPGKDVLPALGALVGCLIFRTRRFAGSKPWRGYDLFIVLQMVGFLGTYLTNRDPIRYGPVTLPGLTFYDFFASSVNTALYFWPPFFLGRTLFRTSKDLRKLFTILAAAGVIYSPFLIIEMLMSPQLNRWIYGFHQSEFIQTIRAGGYRPKTFMRHGLTVSLFVLFTVLAAAALSRIKQRVLGFGATTVAVYLLVVLIFCKSLGAMLYAAITLPFMWWTSVRRQTQYAAILAVVLFSYPVCRAAGLVPIEEINSFTLVHFGEDRAGSLGMRLREEGYVVTRALDRIVFGWGGYARPMRHDPYTGENVAVIDGLWALQIGGQGAVGYIGLFGMLVLATWRARGTVTRITDSRDRTLVACLALMSAVFILDLIPNSGKDPYLFLLVGALVGAERGLNRHPVPGLAPRETAIDDERIEQADWGVRT